MLVATVGFSSPAVLFAQGLDGPASAGAANLSEDQSLSASSRAITGTLLDPSGAAIAKAQVSLLASGDKLLAQETTDNSGSFRFDHIAPGSYTVDFDAEGFRETRVNISLTTRRQAPIRVIMQIAVPTKPSPSPPETPYPSSAPRVTENQNANTIDRNALDRVPCSIRTTSRPCRGFSMTARSGRTEFRWSSMESKPTVRA